MIIEDGKRIIMMTNALEQFNEKLTREMINGMKITINELYGKQTGIEIQNFFKNNYGTEAYDYVIRRNINTELKNIYEEFTSMDWQTSDKFDGKLSDVIISKL